MSDLINIRIPLSPPSRPESTPQTCPRSPVTPINIPMVRTEPLVMVQNSVHHKEGQIHALRLKKILRDGCFEIFKYNLGPTRDTTVGVWVKFCNHWSLGIIMQVYIHSEKCYVPLVRFYEKEVYDRKLGDLVNSLEAFPDTRYTHVAFFVFRFPMTCLGSRKANSSGIGIFDSIAESVYIMKYLWCLLEGSWVSKQEQPMFLGIW